MRSLERPAFLGLKGKNDTLSASKAVVLPIPFERTTSYGRGTEYGPDAIINASQYLEYYDEELGLEPSSIGIHTDGSLISSNFLFKDMIASFRLIEARALELLKMNKFVVSIGGEHSISVALTDAFIKAFKSDFTVIHFDAHADLKDVYEGSRLSHACPLRRIFEKLKTVHLGIRSYAKEEATFIKDKKIKIFHAGIRYDDMFVKDLLKGIRSKDIYITFDMDFLDPSVMPAVGTPEPGGYGWHETLFVLRKLIENRNLLGIDFVELSPLGGKIVHPEFLAAKLIYKVIAYKFFLKKK